MFDKLRKSIRNIGSRNRFESDLDAELADHMAKFTDELVEQGLPRAAAELRARREFGAVAAVKDEVRESSGLALADTLGRNLRQAMRSLLNNPVFTLTAVGTLALCIGANAAIFSVVDAMLFRPFPYPEPGRLGLIQQQMPVEGGGQLPRTSADGATWEWMRDHITTLDLTVWRDPEGVNLVTPDGAAEFVYQMRVSAGFFHVMGVEPSLGREFTEAEDVRGGQAVVVLSHDLWVRQFGANPAVVGKTILLRGEPFTVTGVMPGNFQSIPEAALWTPLQPSTQGEGAGWNYALMGRVKPEYTLEQARAELAVLVEVHGTGELLEINRGARAASIEFQPLQDALSSGYRSRVLMLWTAVSAVLLIGCINLAGLVLSRGAGRRHETATRLALGSGRGGIAAQMLTENALLGGLGGALGLVLSYAAMEALQPMLTVALNPPQPIVMDWRVLAVTVAITMVTILLFGLYPALDGARTDLRSAMGSVSRSVAAGNRWMRRVLVTGEVALAMVLLVSAGLVLRTFQHWQSLDPGFDARDVLTASVSMRGANYNDPGAVQELYDRSLEQIRNTSGVEAAGIGLSLPYEVALNTGMRIVDGPAAQEQVNITDFLYVTPGYFEALEFRLSAGRPIGEQDRAGAPLVALVNEAFVRRYFGEDNPVGRHVNLSPDVHEIVGVVGDVQQRSRAFPIGLVGATPTVYVPAAQLAGFTSLHGYMSPHWVVRTSGAVAEVTQVMRSAVASVDPQLPLASVRSLDQVTGGAFTRERMGTVLLGTLASLALLLAGIGIYGLIAQSVAERRREFGIRMALGATRTSAIWAAARPGVGLGLAGIGLGSLLAQYTGSLMQSLLYEGITPGDLTTFLVVGVVLIISASLASVVPSLRLAWLDPARTLREE